MKSIFFYLLALSVPLILGGGFVYLVWHAISSLFSDWQLKQELEELRVEAAALREQKRSQAAREEVAQNDTSDSDLYQPLDVGHLVEPLLDEIMTDQSAKSEPEVPVADTKSPSVSLDSASSLASEPSRPQAEPSVADPVVVDSPVADPPVTDPVVVDPVVVDPVVVDPVVVDSPVADSVESENSAADASEAVTDEKSVEALEQNTKSESDQDVASPAIESPTGAFDSDRTEPAEVQENQEKLVESTSQNESVERAAPPEEPAEQGAESSPQNLSETGGAESVQTDQQKPDIFPPVEKPEG